MMKTPRVEQKYLSQRDQIKIKLIEDEVLMLTHRIARITRKRDRLMRARDKILDKGLEA
jgi:hypothetical protein